MEYGVRNVQTDKKSTVSIMVQRCTYTGFPRSCNNTVQTDLRTRKVASGKFDSSQA